MDWNVVWGFTSSSLNTCFAYTSTDRWRLSRTGTTQDYALMSMKYIPGKCIAARSILSPVDQIKYLLFCASVHECKDFFLHN